jgi:hypothetical protein
MAEGAARAGARVALVVAALIATLAGALPAPAQQEEEIRALRRAIDELAESQRRIERELRELKGLLQARPGPPPPSEPPRDLVLSLEGLPMKGAPGARLVLVDFTDYQ